MDVSIVIPTYNEEKYLPECLSSLVNQRTSLNYEIIVVDKASEDATQEIAKEMGARVVEIEEPGIAIARHRGVEKAEGHVIISASADAVYPQNWIETLTEPILEREAHLTFGPILPKKEDDWINYRLAKALLLPISHLLSYTKTPFCSADNIAFDKNAFFEIGGYDTSLCSLEDIDLVHRFKKNGLVTKFIHNAVVYTSTRRLKKWGYLRFTLFHFKNYATFAVFGKKEHAKKEYEVVR